VVSQLEVLEFLRICRNYTATRQKLIKSFVSWYGTISCLDNQLGILYKMGFIRKIKKNLKLRSSRVAYQLTKKSIDYLEYLRKRTGYESFIVGNEKAIRWQRRLDREFWIPDDIIENDNEPIPYPKINRGWDEKVVEEMP